MSESNSVEERAGKQGPFPYVELHPKSPPLQITEAGPVAETPQPSPFNRQPALAGIQAAFAQLTDEELQVARLRMLGVPYADIAAELGLVVDEVEELWKLARRKLGTALFGGQ